MNRKRWIGIAAAVLVILMAGPAAFARDNNAAAWAEQMKNLRQRIWVLDGSCVHNVGNLQMNVTNWGCFGSYPSSTLAMAESPSMQ